MTNVNAMKYIACNFDIDLIFFSSEYSHKVSRIQIRQTICFWNFLIFSLTWVRSEPNQQNQAK